jgi:23S rRNA (adenine2030-N6)-methyltransferase
MLSYLHSFHAGNFADVLKHMVCVHTLRYMTQKDKPVFYLDTHSGAGAFTLSDNEAQKNREYENGIGKLWALDRANLPQSIVQYLEAVDDFNMGSELSHYPGSPWFAQHLLRDYDRLSLFELHPREYQTLSKNFKQDRRIHIANSNGFQACISQLPPKEKRGFILMDPPYEVKDDYKQTVESLIKAHKKFATGTYALWYPVVERQRITQLEKAFVKSGIRNIQSFELGLTSDNGSRGMTSSGMLLINPPWTLYAAMEEALPLLAKTLGGSDGVYRIQQLVAE